MLVGVYKALANLRKQRAQIDPERTGSLGGYLEIARNNNLIDFIKLVFTACRLSCSVNVCCLKEPMLNQLPPTLLTILDSHWLEIINTKFLFSGSRSCVRTHGGIR